MTKKANDDLDDIVEYIAVELANPTAASDFAGTKWIRKTRRVRAAKNSDSSLFTPKRDQS